MTTASGNARASSGADEPVEEFAARARDWLARNVSRRTASPARRPEGETVTYARSLQARLADAGLAGLTFPVEYGGQGLTAAHQVAFTREAAPYDIPHLLAVTLGMIAPTLLEVGTEAQKRRFIPPMIRGEELWVQLFSEPTGGSDLAGALTRADRDGEVWVLNGSKVWTTGAHFSQFGLCLARTNWDVPKHQGLSVFVVPLDAPGVTIVPIVQLNGNADFCQEFFDDVVLPADHLLGEVDGGWSVARRVLVHERNATGGASMDGGLFGANRSDREAFVLKAESGAPDSPWKGQAAAESFVLNTVERQLRERVMAGFRSGRLQGSAGSVLKLFGAAAALRRAELHAQIAGSEGVTDDDGGSALTGVGTAYLMARSMAIGGGTNEIQRNIIGERLLDLPREPAQDVSLPFREVAVNALRRGEHSQP